jgi:hypothetical protein
VALNNKNWRTKTLRGNEFGENHTAASKYFAFLPTFRKLAFAV